MPTNAQIAARLLRSAADFFRQVGNQNPKVMEQMEASARSYDVVADLVEKNPKGNVPHSKNIIRG